MPTPCPESREIKGGQNPSNTSDWRPLPPGGSHPLSVLYATPESMLKAVHEKGWFNEDCCHFCHAEFFDGNGARERHKLDCLFFQIEDYLKEIGRL